MKFFPASRLQHRITLYIYYYFGGVSENTSKSYTAAPQGLATSLALITRRRDEVKTVMHTEARWNTAEYSNVLNSEYSSVLIKVILM